MFPRKKDISVKLLIDLFRSRSLSLRSWICIRCHTLRDVGDGENEREASVQFHPVNNCQI